MVSLPAWCRTGGDFTTFDWEVMRIDSVLPVYTEVVPLETDYRRNDYRVLVEYPEYGPLTRSETEVCQRLDSLISERITVESYVGVQRGQGMLDISFIPIVRQQGVYKKLLSARLKIVPVPKKQPLHACFWTVSDT